MKLYFSPLACSLASRITLYEAGAVAEFVEVDGKSKTTADGTDFRGVHALGLVPVLLTDDGELLSENAAILQYIADRFPQAELAPASGLSRTRLQQWLSFIGSELHKLVYAPLLDKSAPQAVKDYALSKAGARLDWVAERLKGRDFALERFSVVDAYLFTVLNWSVVTPIQLSQWPVLNAYVARLRERPAIARAFELERQLYLREQRQP